MYEDLRGKSVIVTGAGQEEGIGFGIASTLAANGMEVVLMDLPSSAVQMCAQRLQTRYSVRTLALTLDITSEQAIDEAMNAVIRFSPLLHALVNNAGIMPPAARVGEMAPVDWQRSLDINLTGPFRLIRACLPLMGRGSAVVNVASRAGKRPSPGYSAYSVSKAGIIMLTKCLAVEYGNDGIRANAICPGQVMTALNRTRFEAEAKAQGISFQDRVGAMVQSIPLGRMGTPEEMGRLCAFLLSQESAYITGQAFNTCGGQLTEV